MFFERSLKIHKTFEVVPYFQTFMDFHKIFSGSLRCSDPATGGRVAGRTMGTPSAMPHATPAASEAIFAAVAAPEAIVIAIYFTG